MTTSAERADARPLPPRAPEEGECCQGGCSPCVYDRYYDALDRYEAELAEWHRRHAAQTTDDSSDN